MSATAELVAQQLEGEFPPEAVAWVHDVEWSGPEAVPLGDVDTSNRENWVATHEPEKVDGFVDSLEEDGELDPIVLYRTPDQALHIADGHHRFEAYERLGQDPVAYVAEVPTDDGPWKEMHSQQNVGPSRLGPSSSRGGLGAWAARATEPGE